MKLHFEPDLDYQLAAVDAVCDLFRGQENHRTEFTVTPDSSERQLRLSFKAIETPENPATYLVARSVDDLLGRDE